MLKAYWRYLARRFKWAKKGAIGAYSLIGTGIGAVLAVLLWSKPDWLHQHISERMNAFLVGMIPLVAGGSLFLIRWLISPYKIYKEVVAERDKLAKQLAKKEDRKQICERLAALITKGARIDKALLAIPHDSLSMSLSIDTQDIPASDIKKWQREINEVISTLENKSVYYARLNDTSDVMINRDHVGWRPDDWMAVYKIVFSTLKRLREFTSELCE